jgi:predicted TPR repeat methyltransferase
MHDREGALEAFVNASALRPGHFEAAVGAAETALALGDREIARRHYERASEIRPDSTRVSERLAELRGRAD